MKKFLIFLIVVVCFTGGFFAAKYIIENANSDPETPETEVVALEAKDFTLGYGFKITLDDSFSKKSTGNTKQYAIANDSVAFIATRDSFEDLASAGYNNISEMYYAQLCINNSGKNVIGRRDETNNWYYFEYTSVVDGRSYKYYSMVKKGQSAYWLCQFSAYEDVYDDKVENFKSWLKTIEINDAQYA